MRGFNEILGSLDSANASLKTLMDALSIDYIIVGGYAVVGYGYERTTHDIDIILSPEDFDKLIAFDGLEKYGFEMFEDGLVHTDKTEIHLMVEGSPYIKNPSETVPEKSEIEYNPTSHIVGFNDLIRLKTKRGRFIDLGDMQELLLQHHITIVDYDYIVKGLSQSALNNLKKVFDELEKEDKYYKDFLFMKEGL
jgi:hypothetical protein